MKTINEAAEIEAKLKHGFDMEEEKYYQSNKVNVYDAFKKGVEFAQQWIQVKEELPEKGYYLVKLSDGTTMYAQYNAFGHWIIFWQGGSSSEDSGRPVEYWRPVELV